MKRRIVSVLCATVVLSMSMAGVVYAGNEETTYDETVQIATAEELCDFSEKYNNGDYLDKDIYVELTADIDMTGIEDFSSIGIVTDSVDDAFNDVFNGNYHTIKNLTADSENCMGLFCVVYQGAVQNLNITDSTIYENFYNANGIIAAVIYNSTVSNCNINNCILEPGSYEDGESIYTVYTGGIAGNVLQSEIISCSVTDSLVSGYEYVGMIAGGEYESTLINCFTSGTVYAEEYYAGGIFGTSDLSICINCGTIADVTGMYYGDVGGFLGCTYRPQLLYNCYSAGDIHAEDISDSGYCVYSAGLFIGDYYEEDGDSLDYNNLFYNTSSLFEIFDNNGEPVDCDKVIIGTSGGDGFAPIPSVMNDICSGVDFTSQDAILSMIDTMNTYVDEYNAQCVEGDTTLCHWTLSGDGTYAVPCTIAVTLYDFEGNVYDTVYGYYGQSIESVLPDTAPEVTDHTFESWYYEGDVLTGPVSAYPEYYLSHLDAQDIEADVTGNLGYALTFSVKQITASDKITEICDSLKLLLSSSDVDADNTLAYDICLLDESGEKVQPNGSVTVTIMLPEDFDLTDLKLYRVEDNGDYTKLEYTIEGRKLTFVTDHFSNYVMTTAQADNEDIPATGDNTCPAALVLLAVAAGTTALSSVKRKRAEN